MNNNYHFAAEKAVRQLDFLAQSYHLSNWLKDDSLQNLVHDLATLLENNVLENVRLELRDEKSRVRLEFRIDFGADGQLKDLRDSAAGTEVPLLLPGLVAGFRLLINPWPKIVRYAHLLKTNWGPAKMFPKDAGDHIDSEHARKITGGRQKGTIFVDFTARHNLEVKDVLPGYAFGRDLALGVDGVFLLSKFAVPGLKFHPGMRLTAVIVQTPRGLQARAIRPAN